MPGHVFGYEVNVITRDNPTASHARRRTGLARLLLLCGAALDMAWLAELWWPTGLSRMSASLSEWESQSGTAGSMWRECFTTADVAVGTGSLIMLGLWRGRASSKGCVEPARRQFWTGWAAIAVYALASAVADLCPASAAPTGALWVSGLVDKLGVFSAHLYSQLAYAVRAWGLHGAASLVADVALLVAIGTLTSGQVPGRGVSRLMRDLSGVVRR